MTGCPVPAALAHLPLCPKRKLPIPVTTHRNPDGTAQFTVTVPAEVDRCARYGLCGVCGEPLGYWIAVLGGEQSADPDRGAYTDAPMHEECAEASLLLCPYIARQRVPRRDVPPEIPIADPRGWVADKNVNGEWVMVITRSFKIKHETARNGSDVVLFRPDPAKRRERRFAYDDRGRLVETTTIREAS